MPMTYLSQKLSLVIHSKAHLVVGSIHAGLVTYSIFSLVTMNLAMNQLPEISTARPIVIPTSITRRMSWISVHRQVCTIFTPHVNFQLIELLAVALQPLPAVSQASVQAGFVLTLPSGDIWADDETLETLPFTHSYTIDSFAQEAARAACGTSEAPDITITASSVAEAAEMFRDVLRECRLAGDYTRLVGSYGHRSIVM